MTYDVSQAFELFFDGRERGGGRHALLRMRATRPGKLNAIAFWFDLHLDGETTITTAPPGVGIGGMLHDAGAIK